MSDFEALLSTLPEGVGDNVNLTKYKSFEDLANGHLEAIKTVGKKGLVLPNKEDPADVARFMKELGRPDSPDQYKLPDGVNIPEELPWDHNYGAKMVARLHQAGLTQEQFQHVMPGYIEDVREQFTRVTEQQKQQAEQASQALKQEWGMAFEGNKNLAERAMATFFGDEANAVLNIVSVDGTRLGDNPAFIKGMLKAAQGISDDQLQDGTGGPKHGILSPESAKQEIAKLQGDSEFMKKMYERDHPEHGHAIARWKELHQQAFPGE